MTRRPTDPSSDRADAGSATPETGAPDSRPAGAGGVRVGVGIDVVSVERIRDLLERVGTPFLDRAFTAAEREYCLGRADPAQHVAARWAAKEAAVKALPDGEASVRMSDVEVTREAPGGAPGLSFAGGAATAARAFGDGDRPGRTLSLSHDRRGGIAAAIVVVTSGDDADARTVREAVAAAHAATEFGARETEPTDRARRRPDPTADRGGEAQ